MIQIGSKVRVLVSNCTASYFIRGDVITVTSVSASEGLVWGYTDNKGSLDTNYCKITSVEELENGKEDKSMTIHRIIVVDKDKNKVIFDGHVCAGDSTGAIAEVAIANAKELAGKNLYTYTTSVASY